ncbi:TIGR01777 family oxidoreductase [Jiangella rhizosphaerae]|uniref:TIGR01777 family protein n=1 Tax=Jiangella rhizosphaerae TaxID=2293569 RepID=A0A418KKD3_9ACTN|nr:TIGR01777 family oxidoreductase [Jiangella rhizosphaerae]RIQ16031.1 TIGR01777 family protein [Jiangella rhizosphaerae]
MRVAVAGSSGFIGTALVAGLESAGHEVIRLVRHAPAAANEAQWDPEQGAVPLARLAGVEAVVHLGGINVGARRWTRRFKKQLHHSRIRSTTVLASALTGLATRPRVFVCASAMGYYGPDRGRELLDEESGPGDGFLARLCQDWEHAAAPASAADIAVCHPRFGLVVGPGGGALKPLLPLFRLGLGGHFGNGEQFWSPVSLHDCVRALRFLVEQHGCVGPYNVTAPEPVTNGEFSRLLAAELHRPRLLPVPGFALQLAVGEASSELLGSLRIVPTRLGEAGFEFDHPDARAIIRAAL